MGEKGQAGRERKKEFIFPFYCFFFHRYGFFRKAEHALQTKIWVLTIYESKFPCLNSEIVLTSYYFNSVIEIRLPCWRPRRLIHIVSSLDVSSSIRSLSSIHGKKKNQTQTNHKWFINLWNLVGVREPREAAPCSWIKGWHRAFGVHHVCVIFSCVYVLDTGHRISWVLL